MSFTSSSESQELPSLKNYVLVRRDPKSHDVTGITIANLTDYFGKKGKMQLEIPA